MIVGQSHDFVAMNRGECVRKDKQTAVRFACQSIEDIIDVGRRIYGRSDRLHAQKGGRFRDRALYPAQLGWFGFCKIATRDTEGAISLSSASHLPLTAYS